MTDQNIKQNIEHYDQVYAKLNIVNIINSVNNPELFLAKNATRETSWHGLYQAGFIDAIKGRNVLELGCGDGLNALLMAKLGANVVALDISEASKIVIEKANETLKLPVTAITGDFLGIDFRLQTFDIVVGKDFLHHLTYEREEAYLRKISTLLKPNGEARFTEPAVNSKFLDALRWIIPVPGRPSKLNKAAFREWKKHDPHPERENSTRHFRDVGSRYFSSVDIILLGSIERFHRIIPPGKFNDKFRRWSHRLELNLPQWFRYYAARSQAIIYKYPKKENE